MQGFLTAVKQEVNRKHAADKWALDDVVMITEVRLAPTPPALPNFSQRPSSNQNSNFKVAGCGRPPSCTGKFVASAAQSWEQ